MTNPIHQYQSKTERCHYRQSRPQLWLGTCLINRVGAGVNLAPCDRSKGAKHAPSRESDIGQGCRLYENVIFHWNNYWITIYTMTTPL